VWTEQSKYLAGATSTPMRSSARTSLRRSTDRRPGSRARKSKLLIGYRLRRVPASRISPANTLDQITTQFSGEVVRRRRRAIAEDRVVSKRQIHFLETEGGEVCGYLAAARELA